MTILGEAPDKTFSRTGVTGAAIALSGILRMIPFTRHWVEELPAGFLETALGTAVILFRKLSDGKTPKVI